MIAPQTMLGRQLVAFLKEYPGTGTDVLEREFGAERASSRPSPPAGRCGSPDHLKAGYTYSPQ